MQMGLTDADACELCAPACVDAFIDARDRRRSALEARARFRARERRLAERAARREAARLGPKSVGAASIPAPAAAALQRALSKAKGTP